jgi:6-phospho-beta-glucosidase
MQKGLKIAVIGGGSTYTPELIEGFIRYCDELPVERISLMDIAPDRLEVVGGLAARMLAHSDCPAELHLTTDRAEALADTDFVLTQMRIGGLAARALDERIPLKHGVLGQETTGPGGFAKALRTVPVMLDIARDIARLAPRAWLINFTNPSGLITEAVLRHTGANVLGLCNVPINMQISVAEALGVPRERVTLEYVGLNHLSWARVLLDGRDVTGRVLDSQWGQTAGIDPAYLRALGWLPNYYLHYYAHPDRVLAEQQAANQTRAERLQQVEAELLADYADPDLDHKPELLETRGGAHYSTAAVELIRAIAQNRREVHIVNVRNGDALPDLPPGCAVEVPAVIGRDGARPLTMGHQPPAIRGLLAAVKTYEELTIDAAVTGDEDTAKMALLAHPLVPSWDVAVALWDDIKTAHRAHLPQFG